MSETGDDTGTDGPSATTGSDETDSPGGTETADDTRSDETAGEDHYAFWADEVADAVEARDPEEPVVIKGGISPSGVPHLGNVNEIMRGYFVAEVLRERGWEVRQVFTTDDRDPLRKLPRKLADLDGKIVDLGDVNAGALGKNLGHAYTEIPDPFGCCDSYGEHFSTLIAESAELLDAPIDVVSTTDLYESGRMDDVVEHVLENRDRAREVLSEYQDKVDEDYVPFNPFCSECGKVTETVTAVRVEDREVDYRCTDIEAGNRTIEGCDHEGTATFREGKLPWRFEWPAQWQVLGVDFEPFGKDHAEGSWPSGVDIAENVLDIEPPEPMVYEWFTLDGEPFSSSEGNIVLVHDVLETLEPEVLRFFFAKDPNKARDFSVERLDQLVDEFDRVERLYYGEESGTEREERRAERVYPFLSSLADVPSAALAASGVFDVGDTDEAATLAADFDHNDPEDRRRRREFVDGEFESRVRLPYTFAAVLGMFDDEGARAATARKEGHVADDDPEWAVEDAFGRVALASEWADRTDNEYNYTVSRATLPEVDVDEATAAALDDLADFVADGADGEAIQGEIYESAKRHDVEIGEFFGIGYRLFFGEEEGPQLGYFLGDLDRAFVVERLRRQR
ncbi:lysyl-tRNA ligase [Halosimplex carlsbadense 2-9-1]|uniref:Lysine--tRNA ligase n=1 Tax=Halosimplex carlsbadense 2-9-1 TaxID=797114 RepID=M0D2P1_9EURY|nr:lysine--tRNA ligase [Halosimplex carlsbadense]ELZ29720.1 lysyl-tRNA ligase [Halosimplex carlsbadense 2-9-1]